MVRFHVYVERGVSGFGVSHILPIGQVEDDIEEVYGFLVGLDCNFQAIAIVKMPHRSFLMSSVCRGDALEIPRPSSRYKPKSHVLPNFSLILWRG